MPLYSVGLARGRHPKWRRIPGHISYLNKGKRKRERVKLLPCSFGIPNFCTCPTTPSAAKPKSPIAFKRQLDLDLLLIEAGWYILVDLRMTVVHHRPRGKTHVDLAYAIGCRDQTTGNYVHARATKQSKKRSPRRLSPGCPSPTLSEVKRKVSRQAFLPGRSAAIGEFGNREFCNEDIRFAITHVEVSAYR